MDADVIIGIVVIAAALAFLAFLVLWSRRRIERIARNGFGSARSIERELRRGR
jgi:tetrahydromethanopterin S-methyltransferase subunit E